MKMPEMRQHAEQLYADLHDLWILHAENREQETRREQEKQADGGGPERRDACRDVHRLLGAIGLAGAKILAGGRGGGAHEAYRRPGDEREELRIGNREGRLRRRALRDRPDEREHQHAADVHRGYPGIPSGGRT